MLPGSMANRIDGGKAWASSGVGWMRNEQDLLEAFLSFNPAFELIGAVNWLSHHLSSGAARRLSDPDAGTRA
jgi:hypothetical protein